MLLLSINSQLKVLYGNEIIFGKCIEFQKTSYSNCCINWLIVFTLAMNEPTKTEGQSKLSANWRYSHFRDSYLKERENESPDSNCRTNEGTNEGLPYLIVIIYKF